MSRYFDECKTPEQVKTRWRRLASIHHPDHGGNEATFNRIKAAYDIAMVEVTRPIICEKCGGQGKIIQHQGFHSIALRCDVCSGKGRIYRGEEE